MGSLTPGDDDDAIVGNLVDKLRDGDFENVEDDEAGIAISILMTLMVIFKIVEAGTSSQPSPTSLLHLTWLIIVIIRKHLF